MDSSCGWSLRAGRAQLFGALLLGLLAICGGGAESAQACFFHSSVCFAASNPDAGRVVIDSDRRLSFLDEDSAEDIYRVDGRRVSLLSLDWKGRNSPEPVTTVGSGEGSGKIFFTTTDQMVPADHDRLGDIYQRAGGTTTLLTPGTDGSYCPDGIFCAPYFLSASTDGSRVLFMARERLTPNDTDDDFDLYERTGGITQLLSDGSLAGGPDSEPLLGIVKATPDGAHVFFTTREQMEPTDTDQSDDVYERFGGTTRQITPSVPGSGAGVYIDGVSADGSRVYVDTGKQLTGGAPAFLGYDAYRIENGQVDLVSTGPTEQGPAGGYFVAESAGGTNVYFISADQLVAEDQDAGFDIYEWSNGVTRLISGGAGPTGPYVDTGSDVFGALTSDGRVFFDTQQPLVPADDDQTGDVYVRDGADTRLVSVSSSGANGSDEAAFARIAAGGDRVFFHSYSPLSPDDTDRRIRTYMREGSTTTLVTQGQIDVPVGPGSNRAHLSFTTAGGSVAIFGTRDRLTGDDGNEVYDLYRRDLGPGRTELLSAADTRIISGPVGRTTRRKASFRFTTTAPGKVTGFVCSLDRSGYSACRAPRRYPHLALGDHVFRVKAVRRGNRPEPNPAVRAFEVVEAPRAG